MSMIDEFSKGRPVLRYKVESPKLICCELVYLDLKVLFVALDS
jgi:hypothetical protein